MMLVITVVRGLNLGGVLMKKQIELEEEFIFEEDYDEEERYSKELEELRLANVKIIIYDDWG